VNVFRDGDRYVFALTYGRDADWVRNVLAAERCEIRTRGRTVRLEQPELFTDERRSGVPPPARVVLRAIDAADFLALRRA
jgi:hypothetical protein